MEDYDELIEELEFINRRERTVEELLNEWPKEAYRVDYSEPVLPKFEDED